MHSDIYIYSLRPGLHTLKFMKTCFQKRSEFFAAGMVSLWKGIAEL